MQRIPSLILPDVLPPSNAMEPGDNPKLAYTPEFWEFEYIASIDFSGSSRRYLERVGKDELIQRHKEILKNLRCLSTTDRHIFPRQSFRSSWYWFQKEHQTRLEFYLREIELPETPLGEKICMTPVEAPARPSRPNAGDVLFRYCKPQYAEELVREGKLRISMASEYKKLKDDKARGDDELNKDSYLQGNRTTITHQAGQQMVIMGDIKRTSSCPQYYMFCTACEWNTDLQDELDGACVIITNVEEFALRINKAASAILPDWHFVHMPVKYYDPYTVPFNQKILTEIQKDFKFAYQREYRFLWMNLDGVEDSREYIPLKLGCLADIAELA